MNGVEDSSNSLTIFVRKLDDDSAFPYAGREGQVACCVANKVYVFGGVEQGQGDEPKETNELVVFDLDSQKWSKPTVMGSPPAARSAASLVAVGTKLYLFGGLSHICGWFDDIHVFNTVNNTWSLLDTEGAKPRARDKLQAVAIEHNIYYFGGFGPMSDEAEVDDLAGDDDDDDEYEDEEDVPERNEQDAANFGWFNDLWVLDTLTLKWFQPMQMNLGVPTQRAAHGMCAVGKQLVIFGGRDIDDRQNDVHIFNTDTRKWEMDLQFTGTPPAPRSFHSLSTVGKMVVVFGGRGRDNSHFNDFDILDLEKRLWTQAIVEGYTPPARGQHCALTVGDTFVLFGGSGNFSPEIMQCQTFYKDTFLIKTVEFTAESIKVNGVS